MSIALYDITVPVLLRSLKNTDAWLQKAEAWANENGKSEDDLLSARLAPDMRDFVYQILALCAIARYSVLREGWVYTSATTFPPEQGRTFKELRATIADVLKFVEEVKREDVDGQEGREYTFWTGGEKGVGYEFGFENGIKFLNQFAFPNFWFHTTTAYAILRMKGVQLGKADFLAGGGAFDSTKAPSAA
ncbi:hypothetical protein BFW01_g264 [Lasiodiplodia theobromae]|uniref:DUF1993 domain-containing protein n=1 Tax=Lasiodiplodia theobromae TaxID=45133 RepID=A0A8H7MAZ0_9PEZI|nr:hypothetical protein BFW01_g264 [Lasiodiplodia theobromae]